MIRKCPKCITAEELTISLALEVIRGEPKNCRCVCHSPEDDKKTLTGRTFAELLVALYEDDEDDEDDEEEGREV